MLNSNRQYLLESKIEIVLPEMICSTRGAPSWQEDYLIPISKAQRLFWPAFRQEFILDTDIGEIETRVVGASAKEGDEIAGNYITKGLRPWFRIHNDLRVGSVLEVERIDFLVYNLEILEV
jgi:hypothetical protein